MKDELVWQVRLYERAPSKRTAVILAILAVFVAGIFLLQMPILGIVGAVAVFGATQEFLLPLNYRVDSKGASVKCGWSTTAICWEDTKRVILDEDGVKVSPLAESSRLSVFRGVYLRFDNNRSELLEAIQLYWGHEVGVVGQTTDGGGDRSVDHQSSSGDQETQAPSSGDPIARDE